VESLGSVGYVPQQAFVLSGTVRENIVVGQSFEADWYTKVLSLSCLQPDLEMMVDGDRTEVGERGITLSGGQQQRLSIARAIYCRPSLLVADDPLAAVDSLVCNKIFANLQKLVRERQTSVVLALNQLHLLHKCDHIVFLVEGRVKAQGPYGILMRECKEFVAMVQGGQEGDSVEQADEATSVEADADAEEKAMAAVTITPAVAQGGAASVEQVEVREQGKEVKKTSTLVKAETQKTGNVSR
jgi:ABC-type transport system involved in cytochrome bd biosynthesis fused ATPase/permease subunit